MGKLACLSKKSQILSQTWAQSSKPQPSRHVRTRKKNSYVKTHQWWRKTPRRRRRRATRNPVSFMCYASIWSFTPYRDCPICSVFNEDSDFAAMHSEMTTTSSSPRAFIQECFASYFSSASIFYFCFSVSHHSGSPCRFRWRLCVVVVRFHDMVMQVICRIENKVMCGAWESS